MKMLVNSCISEVDRIGMREGRKSCAARPREWGRHAVSKFTRAVTMKSAIDDKKRSNNAVDIERLKTVISSRRKTDETSTLSLAVYTFTGNLNPSCKNNAEL